MSVRFAVGGKSKTLYLNIVLHPFEGVRGLGFLLVRIEAPSLQYSGLD